MKKFLSAACVVLVLAVAAGCGPIIGQAMRATNGVKAFEFSQGSAGDFRAVRNVLVFAPFEKAEGAYFICRGEDEANLATELQKQGLFTTYVTMERQYGKGPQTLASLRAKSPEELRDQLKLPWAPDAILSGEILERDENVAPTVGMIQELKLRLDLYNLRTKKSASVVIGIKELHQHTIAEIVKELKRRIDMGK
uniref:Lipoprotein n=1 Tax=Geobacter metallireducens TaxID=28232 RepID=A0A831UDY4_GEOME